jgi:WD40 repeat protein
MDGHRSWIASVAFSPDGKRIASGSRDNTIRIWNVNTGREERSLSGHTSGVLAVAFSTDGKQIISGSYDSTVRVWDPAIDPEVLERYRTTFTQVVFSPDGKRIAASARRDKIVLIDALSGDDILTLHRYRPNRPWDGTVAFSPDGNRILAGVGRFGQVVEVWNALTGALEMTLTGHTERVWSAAFSPNGKHIVSGSGDETVKVWNAATGDLERTITGHKHSVNSVTFSPDGRHIISGSEDGTIRIWEASSGTELLTLHRHEERVGKVLVSSDGKLITSCGSGTIKTWDATTGEELMTLPLQDPEFGIGAVDFSPDGRRIVSGHGNGFIKIWDAGTGMRLIDLCVNAGSGIYSVAFSPDGKSICVGYDGGGIALFESVEPAVGQEARRIANSANRLVDELHDEHELYEDVVSRLRDDDTIAEPVRSKALQIANGRLEQDAAELHWHAFLVISSTDVNDVKYREALEKLEKAVSYAPTRLLWLFHLGVAQYRLRAYEDALATMTRAKKMRDDVYLEPDPIIDGYRAMALQQLGRDTEANAVMQQARSIYGDGGGWISERYGSSPLRGHVSVVEKYFAGEDRTLLSIWDLIKENELDKASERIEKARQSKDADYVSRLEGAIRLIEALRNLK